MKKISLGSNRFALIDDEANKHVSLFKWRAMKYKNKYYCVTSLPRFLSIKTTTTNIFLHHLIIYWVYGHRRVSGRDIDHIDGNPLNNLRSNLRFATSSQNNANKRKYGSTSKYKGVHIQRVRGRRKTIGWIAQITCNKKRFHLGSFSNELDAAKAYNKKAEELFGKYALINKLRG